MATETVVRPPQSAPRSAGRSLLLTVPMLLWTLLMFMRFFQTRELSQKLGAVIAGIFFVTLFYLMMKTGRTYRWRRVFFVTLGVLFPIQFIHEVMVMRGTMGIPIEEMIAGRTPFCHLPIPTIILPAALFRTVVFPGSLLPNGGMSEGGMFSMVAIWLGVSLVIGKGWCSYACFFGGIEEGAAAVFKRARIRKIDPRFRYVPWAVLLAMVLLSLALFEPAYCMWLCPFKAVSEYVAARNVTGMVQNGIFIVLFAALVIALPLLTKKRTQCSFFCPFGAFQQLFDKLSVFEVRIDKSRCNDCNLCQSSCPTMSITKESVAEGRALMSCTRCGACVDACTKHAAVWHIKGTQVDVKPERARLMFLYGAWAMSTMFASNIIVGGLRVIIHLFI